MLNSYARKIYSQNGEDGILEYLLNKCGVLHNKCLEIGVHDGTECNTANLIKNKNFYGVLIDEYPNFDHQFYNNNNYKFINKHLETNNVVSFFEEYGLIGNYDVFSLDIDGIDYWILKEIYQNNLINVSVIVLEYQDIIGPDLSVTIPNIKNFNPWSYDHYDGPNYCGASLKAFVNLLRDKYAFVGCESLGFNGFFVNRSHKLSVDMEIDDISVCFNQPKVMYGMEHRWPRTKNMEWITV